MTNAGDGDDWYDDDADDTDDTDDADDESSTSKPAPAAGVAITGHAAISVQDFQAVWWALPQTRASVRTLALMFLAVPGFALVHWLLAADRATSEAPAAGSLLGIVLPSAAMLALALGWGLRQGRARWAQNAVTDLRSTEGVDFVLDDVGLSIDAPGRQSTTAWAATARCLETKDAYAVYLTPNSVMVIPKRAFAAQDQARVSRLLAEKVPNRPLRGVSNASPIRRLVIWVVLIVVFLSIWQFLDPGR